MKRVQAWDEFGPQLTLNVIRVKKENHEKKLEEKIEKLKLMMLSICLSNVNMRLIDYW